MSSKINLQTCEYARKSSIFQDNQLIYCEITEDIEKRILSNLKKNVNSTIFQCEIDSYYKDQPISKFISMYKNK